jgi:hypothetical protein
VNLADIVDLYCQVGTTARGIFNKKVGKTRGMDKIGSELTDIATKNATATFGDDLDDDTVDAINDFVDGRLSQLKRSFRKLNDGSIRRNPDLIDKTETDAAKWFGQTKGHEARGDGAYKIWVVQDPCEVCADNESEGPIPVGEEFSSGDYAPPAHPSCVCDLEYVDEDGDPLDD